MIEFKPRVILHNKSYIILGEDHVNTVFIQDYPKLLEKYLTTLQLLAHTKKIWLEGSTTPEKSVQSFLTSNKIVGNFDSWESDIALEPLETLLLDLFGGYFNTIFKQIGITQSEKSILSVIVENSSNFQDTGKSVPLTLFVELFKLARNSELNKLSILPYNRTNFKKFHDLGQNLAFETKSSPLYKLQLAPNIKRGKLLKKVCESKGGVYFVGADHINRDYARLYGFI